MSALQHDLDRTSAAVRQLFGAAACSCALIAGDDALTFVAADGVGAAAIVGTTIALDTGLAGYTVLSGQPIAVADVGQDQRFARDVAESTSYVPTSILAAPLVDAAGEALGVIEVLDPSVRGADTGRDLDVLSVIAAQVAATVRAFQGVERATDPEVTALVEDLSELVGSGPDGVRLLRRITFAVNDFQRNR